MSATSCTPIFSFRIESWSTTILAWQDGKAFSREFLAMLRIDKSESINRMITSERSMVFKVCKRLSAQVWSSGKQSMTYTMQICDYHCNIYSKLWVTFLRRSCNCLKQLLHFPVILTRSWCFESRAIPKSVNS